MEAREPAPGAANTWSVRFHPVGLRGAVLAFAVAVVVTGTRLPGLGTPPGPYFDEILYTPAAAQYVQGTEVQEKSHPPLAKELMALGQRSLLSFRTRATPDLPAGLASSVAASDGRGVAWATSDGHLRRGTIARDCRVALDRAPGSVALGFGPSAIDVAGRWVAVGGAGAGGPVLVRLAGGYVASRTVLPGPVVRVAMLDDVAFAVTEPGGLLIVGPDGAARSLAEGASHIVPSPSDHVVWVSFPEQRAIVSYDTRGSMGETLVTRGSPSALGAGIVHASQAYPAALTFVAGTPSGLEAVGSGGSKRSRRLPGIPVDALVSARASTLVWASRASVVHAIEPLGLSVLGTVKLPFRPHTLLEDAVHRRVLALGSGGAACIGGDRAFALRFGGAVAGGLAAALALCIALRVFGSTWTALLAAALLAMEGLGFAVSRMAHPEPYLVAFVLAAWFCGVSCVYHARRGSGAPGAWLVAGALAAGMATATKWVGAWTLLGLIGVLVWLVPPAKIPRRRIAAAFVLLPLVAYVATYVPFFLLGNGLVDLVRLHVRMIDFHLFGRSGGHWFTSGWYLWPFGTRAIWLWQDGTRTAVQEIWMAANPVVLVGGLVASVRLGAVAWRRRSAALAFVPLAALVQWIPWGAVSRATFLYHYLPVVPFAAIALAGWAGEGRRRLLKSVLLLAAAAAAFAVLLPLLDGWPVSSAYTETVRRWGGWMFDPPFV